MGRAKGAFNFNGSLFDQVKLLAIEVEKKDKALDFSQTFLSATNVSVSTAQGGLKNLLIENNFLAKKLDIAIEVGLVSTSSILVSHWSFPLLRLLV